MANAKETTKKKYEVRIVNSEGTCNNPLFEKMASKGDITASGGVKDFIGEVVNVKGYADCHITTSEKEFDLLYLDTDMGYISTGSKVFNDSFSDYYSDGVKKFRIVSIKCKKGTTYKAVPVFESMETEVETDEEELPFN